MSSCCTRINFFLILFKTIKFILILLLTIAVNCISWAEDIEQGTSCLNQYNIACIIFVILYDSFSKTISFRFSQDYAQYFLELSWWDHWSVNTWIVSWTGKKTWRNEIWYKKVQTDNIYAQHIKKSSTLELFAENEGPSNTCWTRWDTSVATEFTKHTDRHCAGRTRRSLGVIS